MADTDIRYPGDRDISLSSLSFAMQDSPTLYDLTSIALGV